MVNENNITVISHGDDLDGVAGALVASCYLEHLYFKKPKVVFSSYAESESIILGEADSANEIWISDLSFSNPDFLSNLIKFHPNKKFYIFDHHPSSKESIAKIQGIPNVYIGFVCDGTKCATDLVYDYIKSRSGAYPAALRDLVTYAHSRDLWIRNLKEGDLLTDVIVAMGPYKTFTHISEDYNRVYRNKFTDLMNLSVEVAKKNLETSIKIAEKTAVITELKPTKCSSEGIVVTLIGNGYAGEVGDIFLKRFEKTSCWIVMFDVSKQSVSVRTNTENVRKTAVGANDIVKCFGGGGHPEAAGCPLTPDMLENGLAYFGSLIADIIKTKMKQNHISKTLTD